MVAETTTRKVHRGLRLPVLVVVVPQAIPVERAVHRRDTPVAVREVVHLLDMVAVLVAVRLRGTPVVAREVAHLLDTAEPAVA